MAAAAQDQQPAGVSPASTTGRRSYEREVHPRRHRRVSKKEWAFMGAIAGTSMGIGAIAGGGTGLAIGAIVGGWGAYVGHRCWHWVNK
jgi:outer membrane lipoprotein SlyB